MVGKSREGDEERGAKKQVAGAGTAGAVGRDSRSSWQGQVAVGRGSWQWQVAVGNRR